MCHDSMHRNDKIPTFMTNTSSSDTTFLTSFVAGAVAGAVAKTTIAPFDRTKIYFQVTDKNYRLRKAIEFLHRTYTKDGFVQLWRGNTATMARVVPYAAFQFASYEKFKILLKPPGHTDNVLPPWRRFMAGSLAGMTATTLTYPLDMARARMAITRATFYKSLYQTFHSILFNEGPLKLYRGLVPTLLGVFPYAGSSFFTYETLKDFYRKRYNEQPTPLAKLVSGALAGLVGQSFSYPLDVVRRRMQTEGVLNSIDYRTVLTTIRYIYKTEGLRGVYKGVTMNWIKGPIAVTISFNVYEIVSHFLKRSEYHY